MRLFTNLTALTLSTSCLATPLSTSNPPLLSHVYTFKELQSKHSKHSSHQPYFRFNIFLRKNPHITEAAFHQHWKSVHADLTISQPDAGLRLLRYTQVLGNNPRTTDGHGDANMQVPRAQLLPRENPASGKRDGGAVGDSAVRRGRRVPHQRLRCV